MVSGLVVLTVMVSLVVYAGTLPARWWAALGALDLTFVEHALALSDGRCLAWRTLTQRNALHALVDARASHPEVVAFHAAETAAVARPGHASTLQALHDPVRRPIDLPANDHDQRATALALRLLAFGADPLLVAQDRPGALWAALDLPCPDLARVLFNAIPRDARAALVYEAVLKRRSARTIVRLATFGAPLDAIAHPDGRSAVHLAVTQNVFHDRLPLLLALGASPERPNAQGEKPLGTVRRARANPSGSPGLDDVLHELERLLEDASLRLAMDGPAGTAAESPSAIPSHPRARL